MSRKYGASHDFDKVPSANIDRSSFNRSHGSKFTCDAIGRITGIILFSIETFPIVPNQTIWDKKEMSRNMDIIHYWKNWSRKTTKSSKTL
jgi:hypothetical protein